MFSDLHLEVADLHEALAIPDADVCVVAGDLCRAPANGVFWLAKHIAPAMQCVYVAGNHEFYKGSIREGLEDGRNAAAQFPGIYLLENDSVVVDDARFVGATLWTDYRVEGHPELAMVYARERMNDHRLIAKQRNPWQRPSASRPWLADLSAFAGGRGAQPFVTPRRVNPTESGRDVFGAFAPNAFAHRGCRPGRQHLNGDAFRRPAQKRQNRFPLIV